MFSQNYLKSILDYDPETGLFIWKNDPKKREIWNKRFVGKVAGNLDESRGYVRLKIDGKNYATHRLAWFYMTGEYPECHVDHKNCDRTDARFENLRLATGSQNQANTQLSSRNTSGAKGVSFDKRRNKWIAAIEHNGKKRHLGSFLIFDDAKIAYGEAAKTIFGEFARI